MQNALCLERGVPTSSLSGGSNPLQRSRAITRIDSCDYSWRGEGFFKGEGGSSRPHPNSGAGFFAGLAASLAEEGDECSLAAEVSSNYDGWLLQGFLRAVGMKKKLLL